MYLLIPGLVCVLYIALKIAEDRFLTGGKKEGNGGGGEGGGTTMIPLKRLIKDALFILLAFVGATYLMGYIKPMLHIESTPPIFTGEPGF